MKLSSDWKNLLYNDIDLKRLLCLQKFLENEYREKVIYPPKEDVFNALNNLPAEKVKVVIIGQDPYHEKGQASGYAFSVRKGIALPPSLQNIIKEIKADIGSCNLTSGDLTPWVEQGVLLLNTVLTVREGQANSHKGLGWEQLTTQVIKVLSQKFENLVFILWGNNAKAFENHIDLSKHLVLKSAHPSPLSAYNGFFGCKHFSKTNKYLKEHNKKEIIW